MTDPTMRDVLTRLDAQEKELTELRAARTRRATLPGARKSRKFALAILALLVALVPLSILAANPFADQGEFSPSHASDIDSAYNLGIANGFENPNDPNAPFYYPKDNVTREEMASFLVRTASLNRMAFTSRPSAGPGDNLDADGTPDNSRAYMTTTLTVPGRADGARMLVRVSFTGYAFARSTAPGVQTEGCPCLLRGEITTDGETAGTTPPVNAQIVTRTVVGANPDAIVLAAPNAAERVDFSGSRVFNLAPGTYTFTMTLVRESGTAGNVGFGFGNMQAETVAFDGDGSTVSMP